MHVGGKDCGGRGMELSLVREEELKKGCLNAEAAGSVKTNQKNNGEIRLRKPLKASRLKGE